MDDSDRERYLELLGYVVGEWRWECFAYCLMPNHVHLLVRTLEPNLGLGMQRIHSLYAQGFNERHGRIGHLFQDRYGSSRIFTSERLRYIAGYVDANPVNAKLCAEAGAWPWSSCGAVAAGRPPSWLADRELLHDAFELAVS